MFSWARLQNKNYVFGKARRPLLVLYAVSAASLAGAQTATESADQYRRQSERGTQLRQQLEPLTDIHLQPAQPPSLARLPTTETPCFRIQRLALRIAAPSTLRQQGIRDTLEAIAARAVEQVGGIGDETDSPIGACLGSTGIATIISRAQRALITQGYVTARVLAAPQNLQSGILELILVPGVVSRIVVQTDSARPPAQWNALAFTEGQALNLRDVEQTLENFKRLPSVDADFKIEPADTTEAAEQAGLSQIRIQHHQGREVRFIASLDDGGYKSTGIYQGSITLSLDNTLTLSDLFYVTLSNDLGGGNPGARGTHGNAAHYSMPIGYWTVGTTVNSSRYHQSAAGSNQTYVYSGTSDTTEVSLSRIVHRDTAGKTDMRIKAFQRSSSNYIDDAEVTVQRRVVGGWEIGAGHRRTEGQTRFEAGVALKRGTGDFGTLPAPEDATGDGTSRFALLSYDASYSTPLPAPLQKLRYSISGRLQNNLTPLTPQDRFAIGNRYTVRGFDGETTLVAERGWLMRNEVAGEIIAQQQLYAGVDYGEVAGPSSELLAGKSIAGGVIGWRGGIEAFAARCQFDLFAGVPLLKPDAMRVAAVTAGFNLSMAW